MTEAELVLMSLTNEELDDALRWLAVVLDHWRESRALIEAKYGERRPVNEVLAVTDGPVHLIRAMDLAIIRERAQRGGADPWYAGMPLDGHPAHLFLRYYQERIALNPDEGHKPRLSGAGIVEKVCPGCGEAKPLTVAFWGYMGSTLDHWCRACRHPTQETAAIRAALVLAEDDANAGPRAPVEPFTAADVSDLDPEPARDPALAL